jgi:hypothetical protein
MLQLIGAFGFSSRIAATGFAACCIFFPTLADATGTIVIAHKDGTVNTYGDVEIKVFSGSLFLTSHDGDGTIVVTRAACSYRENIIVCLPTAAALVQEGESNALNLKTGTIYLNYTNSEQPLSHSSAKLPAGSVLLTLSTNNGTFINVRGRIDQLVKQ